MTTRDKIEPHPGADERKARERAHLDQLIALAGLDIVGVTARERPDFVLTLGDGRSIGLEHTEARGPCARVIQACLTNKGAKLEAYRENVVADEFWLLIVSGAGPGSVGIDAADGEFQSHGYDRAFFLDLFDDQVVDLELTS